jgi:hypothetical protein
MANVVNNFQIWRNKAETPISQPVAIDTPPNVFQGNGDKY